MAFITNIFNDKSVSAYGKLIYCALGKFADKNGKCWPSLKTLSECAGISSKTVQRAISELVSCGWVIKEHRKSNSGDFDSNLYELPAYTGVGARIPNLGTDILNRRDCDTQQVGTDVPSNLSNRTNPKNNTDFETFWDVYPEGGYQNSKPQAAKNFAKLIKKGYKADDLIQAAKNYAMDCVSNNITEYCFKASNFVGQKEYFKSYLPGIWQQTAKTNQDYSKVKL